METSIKNRNSASIYRMIYFSNGSSRQIIADTLNLSLPTVSNCIAQLKDEGFIYTHGASESTGGRKAEIMKCVPQLCYSVGVDITKNHISIAVIDLNVNTIDSVRIRISHENTDEYYKRLADEIEMLLDKNNIPRERLSGVGVSMPVIFNSDHKTVFYASVINVTDDSYDMLRKHLPYDCQFFNDADSAGIAERRASKEDYDMIYISLSNTVGGSAIINQTAIPGNNNKASEFGHICIVPHGKKCYCGKEGCLNAYCSASNLSDFTDGNLDTFFEELAKGENKGLMKVFDEYLSYLAYAVDNLRTCYDCTVVIGGYVGTYMNDYMELLRRKALDLSVYDTDGDFIQPCHYNRDASAVGSAIHFLDKFVQSV